MSTTSLLVKTSRLDTSPNPLATPPPTVRILDPLNQRLGQLATFHGEPLPLRKRDNG